MTIDEVQPLVLLAEEKGEPLVDLWGSTSVSVEADLSLSRMHALALLPDYTVTAYFGERREPLRLGAGSPDEHDLARVSTLAPNERTQAEVMAATGGTEAAQLLVAQLAGFDVKYSRRGWARTDQAFYDAVASDWPSVAATMPQGRVNVGTVSLDLEPIASAERAGALSVIVPSSDRPIDDSAGVWDVARQLADAAAWTNLAFSVSRSGTAVNVALHSDQDAIVPITLTSASGGTDLYRWWLRDVDGNREEALRHVFRFATAGSPASLPDARTVQALAERQRIALTQNRAAEVFRAIADGHRETEELLASAAGALADLTESTTNTANATVVAVLGIVALVGSTSASLPAWLVVFATCAAIFGVLAVVMSRRRRITDQETAGTRLLERLENDPLLPEPDRTSARETIADFDIGRRARNARRTISVLGAGACGVAIAAGVWLVWIREPQPSVPRVTRPSLTTTTRPRPVGAGNALVALDGIAGDLVVGGDGRNCVVGVPKRQVERRAVDPVQSSRRQSHRVCPGIDARGRRR